MKNRLDCRIESQRSLWSSCRFVTKFNPFEFQSPYCKFRPVYQLQFQIHQFRLLSLVCGKRLRRECLLPYYLYSFTYPKKIFHCQNCFPRNEFKERHPALVGGIRQLGHDGNALFLLFRKLVFHLKSTDAVYLVTKKVNTVRILGSKREDVNNTTAYSILPRFINIIHMLESVTGQHFRDKLCVHMLTHTKS